MFSPKSAIPRLKTVISIISIKITYYYTFPIQNVLYLNNIYSPKFVIPLHKTGISLISIKISYTFPIQHFINLTNMHSPKFVIPRTGRKGQQNWDIKFESRQSSTDALTPYLIDKGISLASSSSNAPFTSHHHPHLHHHRHQTEQLHRRLAGDATKGYLRVNLYLFDGPLYLLLMSLFVCLPAYVLLWSSLHVFLWIINTFW